MTTARSAPKVDAASAATLLSVRDLNLSIVTGGEQRQILREISLTVERGEALALVGESGAGKSLTARAVARILPANSQETGSIRFAGQELIGARGAALRQARRGMAVIFQDPRTSINPVRRVGDFVTEQLRLVHRVPRSDATRKAQEMLGEVGFIDTGRVMRQYPGDLSGGMLQRVMIAAALLGEPTLILADEISTALDVTTQAEVMAILTDLRERTGVSMLFITHDLDLAAAVCDRTAVMYAGQIVESQSSSGLHSMPLHPYGAALAGARPNLDRPRARLAAIPGNPAAAWEAPHTCGFSSRCEFRQPQCLSQGQLPLIPFADGMVRCARAGELHDELRRSAE